MSLKQKSATSSTYNNTLLLAKKILKEYPLCTLCTGRLFAKKLGLLSNEQLGRKIYESLKIKPPSKCFVCKNTLLNAKYFVEKMLDATSEYEFSTFLVGTVLKPSIADNDDIIRSKFRLRGIDSVKTDFTKQISKIFSKKTKTRTDYLNPEITITVNLKDDSCQIKPKSLFLYGKYTKTQRGIPQKEKPCSNCAGKGCSICRYHGICTFDSVEGKIAQMIFKKFGADQIKITWIGGEDKSSLILNKGRPFFAKVINPKKRSVKFAKTISLNKVLLHGLHIIKQHPKKPLSFRTKIELHVKTAKKIKQNDLKLLDGLKKTTIAVYDKNKRVEKSVYSIRHKALSSNSFSLQISADGGLPIKRFVEGADVFPNLSDLLETKCTCQEFDFHEIKLIN